MKEFGNDTYKHSDITSIIIGCATKVHSAMGNGFQEVIYQRCLAVAMDKQNLRFTRELEMEIITRGLMLEQDGLIFWWMKK